MIAIRLGTERFCRVSAASTDLGKRRAASRIGGLRQFAAGCRTRTDDTMKICDFFCERAYTLIEPIHSLFRRSDFPVRVKTVPCSASQGIPR
jgi:hypothetical protein